MACVLFVIMLIGGTVFGMTIDTHIENALEARDYPRKNYFASWYPRWHRKEPFKYDPVT